MASNHEPIKLDKRKGRVQGGLCQYFKVHTWHFRRRSSQPQDSMPSRQPPYSKEKNSLPCRQDRDMIICLLLPYSLLIWTKNKKQLPIQSKLLQTQKREMKCSAIFCDRFYVRAHIFEAHSLCDAKHYQNKDIKKFRKIGQA